MLEAARVFTAQINDHYRQAEAQFPPRMRADLVSVNHQFSLQKSAEVDPNFLYVLFVRPDISKAIHLAVGRTEIRTRHAVEKGDPSELREYMFTVQHNPGEGIILGPMGVQSTESGYDEEETRAISDDLSIRGTILMDFHTHPTFWEIQRALTPSVIEVEEGGTDLGGDMWSLARTRRTRKAELEMGMEPSYSERVLKVIYQTFPDQNLVTGLYIFETDRIVQMDDEDYARMLIQNRGDILNASRSSEVRDVLRNMGFRASLIEVPHDTFYRYSIFTPEHLAQVTEELID